MLKFGGGRGLRRKIEPLVLAMRKVLARVAAALRVTRAWLTTVLKDSLLWKALLLCALFYFTQEVTFSVLLDQGIKTEVKAALLALLAATGIAINTIPVRALEAESSGHKSEPLIPPRWYGELGDFVNGSTAVLAATTGWFAAQQWLLSVSEDDSYRLLMFSLGLIAVAALYLGFLIQPSRR